MTPRRTGAGDRPNRPTTRRHPNVASRPAPVPRDRSLDYRIPQLLCAWIAKRQAG